MRDPQKLRCALRESGFAPAQTAEYGSLSEEDDGVGLGMEATRKVAILFELEPKPPP